MSGAGRPGHQAPGWGTWLLGFGIAFFFLNALLTFENRWPGAGVRFGPRLSFELCVGVLGLVAWSATGRRLGPRALSALAVLYSALVLARYADVTVPALFGRPVNLYWDAPHFGELLRLAVFSLPGWQVAGIAAAALSGLVLLFASARWALELLARGLARHRPRPWLLAAGAALGLSFAVHPFVERDTRWFFSLPVSPTLLRQALLLPTALSPPALDARLGPGPRFDGNVAGLGGADVLLIFAESYGMTSFDDPRQAGALAPGRERLLAALQASGRQVVSGRVTAPTFGGSSWLAHAALLAGIDTRRPDDHDLLLASDRTTLVRHFARHGYRTVAWMPGLQRPWPEGSFYGFDRLAQADTIGYRGPGFGYWRIPDQASLALLHAQELADTSRAPRFVVFPTVSTHAPFRPLAPYVSDWSRLLRDDAYAQDELAPALAEPLSWLDPLPAYLQSLAYTHAWLAGYLHDHAAQRLLVLVVGDHQPMARVSGPQASWDVPVHVISGDAALLRRFEAAGFRAGLEPPARTMGPMHELTALLVALFDASKHPGGSPQAVKKP